MGLTVRGRRGVLAVTLLAGTLLAVPGLGGGAARAAVALEVTSSETPSPLITGEPAAYTVTVRNTGDSPAADVQTDITATPAGSLTTGALPSGCAVSGAVMTCTSTTVGAGGVVSYHIPVTVNPSLPDGTSIELRVTAQDAPGATASAQPLITQAVCAAATNSPASPAPSSSPAPSRPAPSQERTSATARQHAAASSGWTEKDTPRAPHPSSAGSGQAASPPPIVPVTG